MDPETSVRKYTTIFYLLLRSLSEQEKDRKEVNGIVRRNQKNTQSNNKEFLSNC